MLGKKGLSAFGNWKHIENFLDSMQREITSYLTRLYQSDVNESEAKEISSLMRMTNNIERLGDSVENIAQITERIIENNLSFTPAANEDIRKISGKVTEFLNLVTKGMQKHDEHFMKEALFIENDIDTMREELRQVHIRRLRSGDCAIDPGLVYINLLSNFEKMGDYCYNIAEAVAGLK